MEDLGEVNAPLLEPCDGFGEVLGDALTLSPGPALKELKLESTCRELGVGEVERSEEVLRGWGNGDIDDRREAAARRVSRYLSLSRDPITRLMCGRAVARFGAAAQISMLCRVSDEQGLNQQDGEQTLAIDRLPSLSR